MMINQERGTTVLSVTKNKTQDKVIECLLQSVQDKENLIWYYTDDSADALAEMSGLKKYYLDKILSQLVDLGVLLRRTRGVYVLSKEYFQVKEEKAGK